MGDLSCGCGRSNDCNNCNSCNSCNNNRGIFGNNSCMWIILLLLFCGGDDCGCGLNGILGNSNNNNNGCCDLIIWIILLSFLCGNNC